MWQKHCIYVLFHGIPIQHLAAQKKKKTNGTPSSFVAPFGQRKVRAVGLISSGVLKTERIAQTYRINGLIPDGIALERSDWQNAFSVVKRLLVWSPNYCSFLSSSTSAKLRQVLQAWHLVSKTCDLWPTYRYIS